MTHDNGDRSDDGDDHHRGNAGEQRDDVGSATVEIPVDVVEHNPVGGHADSITDTGSKTKTVLAAGLAVGVVLGVLAYLLRRLRR